MASNESSKPARACRTCVKAKSKCVLTTEGLTWNSHHRKCRRCLRLNKECSFEIGGSVPTTPRVREEPNNDSRVTRLEERVDKLVTLLNSNQGASSLLGSSQLPSSTETITSLPSINQETSGAGENSVEVVSNSSIPRDHQTSSSWSDLSTRNDTLPSTGQTVALWATKSSRLWYELSPDEADQLLEEYRRNFAWQFPFVVIPPNATPDFLVHKKPYLWRAIISTASYRDASRQGNFRNNLMEDLSRGLLLQVDRSLDLLQGILVVLCFYHYHLAPDSIPLSFRLLALARVIAMSLRLDRTVIFDHYRILLHGLKTPTHHCHSDPRNPDSRFFDAWRTLSGLFYVASVYSGSCHGYDGVPYTEYLSKVSQNVSARKEYPTDELIAPLVELQRIDLAIQALYLVQRGSENPTEGPLVKMQVQLLQKELDNFYASLPSTVKNHSVLVANFHASTVRLYGAALGDPSQTPFSMMKRVPVARSIEEKSYRLSAIHSLFTATSTYLTHFSTKMAGPTSSSNSATNGSTISILSTIGWSQFDVVLLIAIQLCFATADGWDNTFAQQTLRVESRLDELANQLQELITLRKSNQGKYPVTEQSVGAQPGKLEQKDIFLQFSEKLQQIIEFYRAKHRGDPVRCHILLDGEEKPSESTILPHLRCQSDNLNASTTFDDVMHFTDMNDEIWQDLYRILEGNPNDSDMMTGVWQ